MMRAGWVVSAALLLAACGEAELVSEAPAAAPDDALAAEIAGVPAGAYTLDATHASIVFRVPHMGFSNYTGQFKRFSVELQIDPRDPAGAKLVAEIDPASLDLTGAPDGFAELLLGPAWLDAAAFPAMTYRSTTIEMTGPDRAIIHGDFTLRGVTSPVDIAAVFNGGYAGQTVDPQARIGFSATGVLKRSAFGISLGVPTPPSEMGVGDDVMFEIETELLGPAWRSPLSAGVGATE